MRSSERDRTALRAHCNPALSYPLIHPAPIKLSANVSPLPTQVPELLGTTENELGIRKWLEDQGHTLVTTSDKEGENSKFDQELVDAEIIITTP